MTGPSRRKPPPTSSSSLVIGVATLFVFVTAVIGLFADRSEPRPGATDGTWSLRGELDDVSSPSPIGHHTQMSFLLR